MITQYYPNPTPKIVAPIKSYAAPAANLPTSSDKMANGMWFVYNKHQADKKNITVEEFVRRDVLVREKAKELGGMLVGDYVYPYSKAEFEKHGKHKITQLYHTYADFENSDWDEEKWPFLIGARSAETPALFMTATPGYFKLKEPTE